MAIFLCIEILVLLVTSVDIFGEIKKISSQGHDHNNNNAFLYHTLYDDSKIGNNNQFCILKYYF